MRCDCLNLLAALACLTLTASLARCQQPTLIDDSEQWKKHIVYEGVQSLTAVAGDFSGDGLPDVVCNAGGKTLLLVAPNWNQILLDDDQAHDFIHSEVYDVDGDGDLDYIAARYDPGLIVWFEQPAQPLSDKWPMRLIDDQVHGIHGLLRGDVDGDGQVDLLATSAQPKPPYPNSLAWFSIPKDVKNAQRWERTIFAKEDAPGLTHYLGIGDVNGDGRPDAATGAKGGPQDASGTGEWFAWWEAPANPRDTWQKHLISNQQPGATNIHPADVNGDGKTDFIASRGHGEGVVWFEGSGDKWQEHAIDLTLKEPHCLQVVDMDGDGDVDAATCAYGSQIAAWFENDGTGKFVTHIVGRNQESYDIRAVDMDNDQDLDLLVAGRGSQNVVWYANPQKQAEPVDPGDPPAHP